MGGVPEVLQQDLERPAREVLPQVPGPPGHQFQAGQLCYIYRERERERERGGGYNLGKGMETRKAH